MDVLVAKPLLCCRTREEQATWLLRRLLVAVLLQTLPQSQRHGRGGRAAAPCIGALIAIIRLLYKRLPGPTGPPFYIKIK